MSEARQAAEGIVFGLHGTNWVWPRAGGSFNQSVCLGSPTLWREALTAETVVATCVTRDSKSSTIHGKDKIFLTSFPHPAAANTANAFGR